MAIAMATLPSDRSDRLTRDVPPVEGGQIALGAMLRQARERSGLTLNQVSMEMKISRHQLEALERGTFTNVPSGFYQRAQIRAYARVVHLDEDLALAEFNRIAEPVAAAPQTAPQRPMDDAPAFSRHRMIIAAGIVVAAVLLVRAMVGREPAANEGSDAPRTAASTEQGLPATAAAVTPALATSAASEPDQDVISRTSSQPASVDAIPAPARREAAATTERPPLRSTLAPGAASPQAVAVLEEGAPAAPAAATKPAIVPEAPAEPAPAAVPVAALVVTTDPPGARVTVNGIAWGTTPIAIRYLPPGDKRIRVSKDGYLAEERALYVAEGRPASVALQLRAINR